MCPPQIEDMKDFEADVWKMLEKIEFRGVTNAFIDQLKADAHRIKSSSNAFVSADKTRNFYEIAPDEYLRILTNNVTKSYKKADNNISDDIYEEAQEIAVKLNVEKKLNTLAEQQCFFTVKDHKPKF